MIYLLHFDRPFHHARHYLGYAQDVDERVRRHWKGHGSRLVRAVMAAGIGIRVTRTWEGDRTFERKLHDRHNSAQLCPVCCAAKDGSAERIEVRRIFKEGHAFYHVYNSDRWLEVFDYKRNAMRFAKGLGRGHVRYIAQAYQ